MKKNLLLALLLISVLCACNRTEFIKKLEGSWKINHYIFTQQDETASFMDTTHVKFLFEIEGNNRYLRSWIAYSYRADSIILTDSTRRVDTVLHDTTYIITFDTVRFIDTTISPYAETGRWDLLNSEEDLQLTSDSDANNPVQYQILKLNKNTLNLLNGNSEYDMTKE